jgi:uncharacterized membrane protein YkvA (DUF1232 family)
MTNYADNYNEGSFWSKLAEYAVQAGRDLVVQVLTLYYCMMDNDTPAWAKGVIVGALGYFICPIDAIPDMLPGGYTDDFGLILSACATVAAYIKDEHKERAEEKVKEWFG